MLNSAENFAASQVLTEWPEAMTYDELLDAIRDGHEDVIIWEQFENELTEDVIDTIEGMRVSFLASVLDMTANLRESIYRGDPMDIADQLRALESQLGL